MEKDINVSSSLRPMAEITILDSHRHQAGSNSTNPVRNMVLVQFELATLALMFTTTVIGNALALLAVVLRRRRHVSRMHFFILHLCISDLVVAFFQLLPQFVWDTMGSFPLGGYPGDNVVCKLIKFLQMLGPYASSYVLVATAVDRYQAICFPLVNCTWTSRRSKLMVGAAWMVSLLFSLPQAFIFSYTVAEPYEHLECWATFVQPWGETTYVLFCIVAVFLLPLVVLLFTYSRVCRVIWDNAYQKARCAKGHAGKPATYGPKLLDVTLSQSSSDDSTLQSRPAAQKPPRAQGLKNMCGSGTMLLLRGFKCNRFDKCGKVRVELSETASDDFCSGPNHQDQKSVNGNVEWPNEDVAQPRSHSTGNGISRAKMKTIRLTIVVILCYIVCSAPYFGAMAYVYVIPGGKDSDFAKSPAFAILALVASLNSCVNPWLYLAFNENLARTLKELFCCDTILKNLSAAAAVATTFSRSSFSDTRSVSVRPSSSHHVGLPGIKQTDKVKVTLNFDLAMSNNQSTKSSACMPTVNVTERKAQITNQK